MESKHEEALPEIANRIRIVRGQRVLLDSDLALLYGVVPTKRLNEQVRRNIAKFPGDFIFSPTNQELAVLRSQFATLKSGSGRHRKYAPMVFTEHGAIMAATVLNSPTAVEMSVMGLSRQPNDLSRGLWSALGSLSPEAVTVRIPRRA